MPARSFLADFDKVVRRAGRPGPQVIAYADADRSLRPPQSYPAQEQFWGNDARFRAFIGGIGSGKSLCGCYEALSQPRSLGAIIAPTYPMLRDATLRTFLEVARAHNLLETFHKQEMTATLKTGSQVLFRTSDDPEKLRGPNLGWFYLDEAALMDPETWLIMIGRLREQPGRAWATTTPKGYDWLFDLFAQSSDPNYWLVTTSTRDNPFLPTGYVESLEAAYDDHWRAQEIEGQFVAFTQHAVFDVAYLARLVQTLADPLRTYAEGEDGLCGALEVYEWPEPGVDYVIGADVSEGLKKAKSDESSADVVREDTGRQVAVYHGKPDPKSFAVDLGNLAYTYNNAEVCVENNSVGLVVVAYLEEFQVRLWYHSGGKGGATPADDARAGFRTTERTKQMADQELRVGIIEAAAGRFGVGISSKGTAEQLVHYVYLPTGGRGGEGTWHDDRVRSLALAWYVVKSRRDARDDPRDYVERQPRYVPEFSEAHRRLVGR